MIIGCPNCSTNYKVDDAALQSPRNLRCARCHHSWSNKPEIDIAAIATETFAASCPGCATQYRIRVAAIPATGQQVRCGKCQRQWREMRPRIPRQGSLSPEQREQLIAALKAFLAAHEHASKRSRFDSSTEMPEATDAVAGFVGIPQRLPEPAVASKSALRAPVAHALEDKLIYLFGSVAAAALLVFALAGLRTHVANSKSWVQARNTLPVRGLILRDINYRRETTIDGHADLIVDGRIENHAPKAVAMPKTIRIRLNDENHQELYQTTITPSVAVLGANKSIAFQTEIYDAPQRTIEMQVTLDQKF